MARFVKQWSMEDRARMIDDLLALQEALDDSIEELQDYQLAKCLEKLGIDPYDMEGENGHSGVDGSGVRRRGAVRDADHGALGG